MLPKTFIFLSNCLGVHQRSAVITSCILQESAVEILHSTVESFIITVESVPDLESAQVCLV